MDELTGDENGRLLQISRKQLTTQPNGLDLLPKFLMNWLPIRPRLLVGGVAPLEGEQVVSQGFFI